ncbi:hypothetical protein C8J56DRAFT_14892 [Mycena floridula]|nr:hypothetical protein C8J56DRAFT_14892 [Mycena floridula]
MSRFSSYTIPRFFLYSLLWLVSVALLGVTAFRIHFTRQHFFPSPGYERIVAELLVTSILTILWTPFAFFMLFRDRFTDTFGSPRVHHEHIGLSILWLMWLVGAVITTNRIIPGKNWCGVGQQCDVLTAILALAWTGWSLLTLLGIFSLMHTAAARAVGSRVVAPATTKHAQVV